MHRLRSSAVLLLCLVAALVSACASSPSGGRAPSLAPAATERLYWTNVLDEEELAELRELAPGLAFVHGIEREEALERAAEFHAADAHLLDEAFLERAVNLEWVQSWSAGVERYLRLEGLRESASITLTNMAGVHGPVIAEHVFALLLHLRRDLGPYLDAQRDGRWDSRAAEGQVALAGSTLFVAGMGGIGSEVARRGKAFDMEVLATVRTRREPPDHCDELGTAEDLDRFLARADVVVIALPLTDETRGLFDAERLGRIKPGAILVNVARGPIVDTDALLAALESGRIAGACLDVTDPEPLPADHPLWSRDDVVITPHVAGRAELTQGRRWDLFRENARRFAEGEELLNVVDKARGY